MDTPVTTPQTGTQLTLVQRAAAALGASEREKALQGLATKHTGITAITNEAGRDDCHSAYMELKTERVDLEKRGKDAREDAQAFAKAVIAEEKRLVGIIGAEEERLKKLRDDWDAEEERKRVAAAEEEKRRVDDLQARVTEIRGLPATCVGKSAKEIDELIETTRAITIGPDYQEFRVEAEDAVRSSLAQMCVMATGQKAREVDEQQRAEEKAELDRLRKERDERVAKEEAERQARVRAEEEQRRVAQEAENRKQQEALAAQRAQQEKEMAEARVKHDADLATQRAEQARLAAEAKARQDAEEKRLADERAAIERKEAELAAQKERIDAGAPVFYKALRDLEKIVTPGSPEDEIIQRAFRAAEIQ